MKFYKKIIILFVPKIDQITEYLFGYGFPLHILSEHYWYYHGISQHLKQELHSTLRHTDEQSTSTSCPFLQKYAAVIGMKEEISHTHVQILWCIVHELGHECSKVIKDEGR